VPAQLPHTPPRSLPLPWQTGHTLSPVPGVPRGASSPGFIGAAFGAAIGVDFDGELMARSF
jgi:hypothetical protein